MDTNTYTQSKQQNDLKMKIQLPAKYTKMTVCTFWLLKQLKSMGMLTEEQMAEASEELCLTKDTEDQLLYYKDLVENFKDHENYLKMYANSKKDDDDDEDDVVDKIEKKQEDQEIDLIRMMMMMHNGNMKTPSSSPSSHESKKKIKIIIRKKM